MTGLAYTGPRSMVYLSDGTLVAALATTGPSLTNNVFAAIDFSKDGPGQLPMRQQTGLSQLITHMAFASSMDFYGAATVKHYYVQAGLPVEKIGIYFPRYRYDKTSNTFSNPTTSEAKRVIIYSATAFPLAVDDPLNFPILTAFRLRTDNSIFCGAIKKQDPTTTETWAFTYQVSAGLKHYSINISSVYSRIIDCTAFSTLMYFLYEYRKSDDSQTRIQVLVIDTSKITEPNFVYYTFMNRSTLPALVTRLTAGVIRQEGNSTFSMFGIKTKNFTKTAITANSAAIYSSYPGALY